MKDWCKIIKVKGHDVLVQRLVNKTDGEHVIITLRVEDGQYLTTALCGDGDKAEKISKELYQNYNKKDALKLVETFNKLLNDADKEEEGFG